MTKKELKEKTLEIKNLESKNEHDEAFNVAQKLIKELFSEGKFSDIVLLDNEVKSVPICFELAFSYDKIGKMTLAEEVYETVLTIPGEEENTAILNNLSNIKKTKGDLSEAFELIEKAYKIDSEDEIIANNYRDLLSLVQEKEQIKIFFESAKENVKKETEWALTKLRRFIENFKNDKDCQNNKLPIAKYKFKVMIGTDEQKADSLRTQWLDKGYIRDTKKKGDFSVTIYEINPNIEKYLDISTPKKINIEWLVGFENLNPETLEKLNYYSILEKIEKKVNKKYKSRILRDFDELVINYVLKNKKATIILAGSFVELLFTFICEKDKLTKLEYSVGGKIFNQKLYDCKLNDFLQFFEEKKKYKEIVLSISNITRTYRNFIHPGNEIKNNEELTDSKFELCFHSVLELINYII